MNTTQIMLKIKMVQTTEAISNLKAVKDTMLNEKKSRNNCNVNTV